MTKEQFNILVKAMKAVYSDPKFIADKHAFNVWYSLLNDLEYDMASVAIQKYMATNKFPPTIADIRGQYVSLAYPQELSTMQAWELVVKTLLEIDKNGVATKRFEALPELTRKAIGGREQFLELANNPSIRHIAQSGFVKSYTKLFESDLEKKMLPPEIRKQAESNILIENKQGALLEIERGDEDLIGDEWIDI